MVRLHMNICKKCNNTFKTRIKIDGKWRSINKRKYCLTCSPFNLHNTKQLDNPQKIYNCACGETEPSNFYGDKHTICAKCHNKYTIAKGKENKANAVKYMGGKCSLCSYDKCIEALEFHHINPDTKDINFKSMRGWSWNKTTTELDKCILVCSNCHREIHSDLTNIQKDSILDT